MIEFTLTNLIIAFTSLVSITAFYHTNTFDRLKFNAYFIHHSKQPWRFITHAFVHVDYLHLVMNMFVLYVFGNQLEQFFKYQFQSPVTGLSLYVFLYLSAALMSSLYSYEKHKHHLFYNAVGASGSVSAILFAYIAVWPTAKFQFVLFPGIGFPAFMFGAGYLFYSWYMTRNKRDNVGHDAHFLGSVYGFIFLFLTFPSLFGMFVSEVQNFISSYF